MKEKEATRINKFLSEMGYCSRRAADKLIEQGRVTINGKVPEMGTLRSTNPLALFALPIRGWKRTILSTS